MSALVSHPFRLEREKDGKRNFCGMLKQFPICVECSVDREVHATAGQEAGATCCFPALLVLAATGNLEPSRRFTLYQQAKCAS